MEGPAEGAGGAETLEIVVKQPELQALAVHPQDKDRLAGRGGVGREVGRVLGDENVVGRRQEGDGSRSAEGRPHAAP